MILPATSFFIFFPFIFGKEPSSSSFPSRNHIANLLWYFFLIHMAMTFERRFRPIIHLYSSCLTFDINDSVAQRNEE